MGKSRRKASFGFNAATEEHGDTLSAGIIDPTKVIRTALQNAASLAGLMITTECLNTDIPEEEGQVPRAAGVRKAQVFDRVQP